MPTIRVDLAERSYDVVVEYDELSVASEHVLAAGLAGRAAIITDENVERHHCRTLTASLAAAGISHSIHVIPAGESSKSLAQTEALCRAMAAAGHDRTSFVIALGGGVVGDLAGFVASVFQRGIPYVQIPTTIVSQVDSSVGGKTGVNIPEGKNLVGAFHQPRLVLVDPGTLQTLPDREFREGFAEVIKHAAIRDAAMLADLEALDTTSRLVPADLIARNISIKARIVEADEHETKGPRALLNFGHTIGHGIEAAVPYGQLLHGEAISLGIRAALDLSCSHARLPVADARRIISLLERFGLPVVLPAEIPTPLVLEKLSRDKKFSAGKVRFVVLTAAGSAHVTTHITRDDMASAIERLRQRP
jgi:3-dehydroquinate synthase